MLNRYATSLKHKKNVSLFERILDRYSWLELHQPNPEKAPWHERAILTDEFGGTIVLNFWPCSLTAQREGCKSVKGVDEIRLMISEAIDDCQAAEAFDVLEAGQ